MKLHLAICICIFSQLVNAQSNQLFDKGNTGFQRESVIIKNTGSKVNSPFSDFAPLISANGLTMVFTSRRVIPSAFTTLNKVMEKNIDLKEGNPAIYITHYDKTNQTWLDPIILESSINLPGIDNTALALSNDGQKMLLYRGGVNKNINKGVFESKLIGNKWSVPTRLQAPISCDYIDCFETSASYSPDEKTIFFVSNRKGGLGGQDIWYSKKDESGRWKEAINLGESINSKEDEGSVFMHQNGNTLFFSSKGHNSIGGFDVFVSHFDGNSNSWSKAESLGSPINTKGDDTYFVMTANGKYAFYSSSNNKELADNDIFSVRMDKSKFLKDNILLLTGMVIGENGLGIESEIVVKEKSTGIEIGTANSNKLTGKYLLALPLNKDLQLNFTDVNNGKINATIKNSGKQEYYEIEKNVDMLPKEVNLLSKVFDENGAPLSGVLVELYENVSKQLSGKTGTNSDGEAKFTVPFEKKFTIVFKKFGYFFQSVNFSIPQSFGSETKEIGNVVLQKIEVDKLSVLNNITFDLNQKVLEQESFLDLDNILSLINDMNTLCIEISSHTDNSGFQDNMKVSKKRAKELMDYLIIKGCEKKRLTYKSFGAIYPVAPNDTEEGRLKNNRIELKVVKIDWEIEKELGANKLKEELTIIKATDNINNKNEENTEEFSDTLENSSINKTELKPDNEIDFLASIQHQENNDKNSSTINSSLKTNKKNGLTENEQVESNVNPKSITEIEDKKSIAVNSADRDKKPLEGGTILQTNNTVVTIVKKDENKEEEEVEEEEEQVLENQQNKLAENTSKSNANQTEQIQIENAIPPKDNKEPVVNAITDENKNNNLPKSEQAGSKANQKSITGIEDKKSIAVNSVDRDKKPLEEGTILQTNNTVVTIVKKDENKEEEEVEEEEEQVLENQQNKLAENTSKSNENQTEQIQIVNAIPPKDNNEAVINAITDENKNNNLPKSEQAGSKVNQKSITGIEDKKSIAVNSVDRDKKSLEEGTILQTNNTVVTIVKKDENKEEEEVEEQEEQVLENQQNKLAKNMVVIDEKREGEVENNKEVKPNVNDEKELAVVDKKELVENKEINSQINNSTININQNGHDTIANIEKVEIQENAVAKNTNDTSVKQASVKEVDNEEEENEDEKREEKELSLENEKTNLQKLGGASNNDNKEEIAVANIEKPLLQHANSDENVQEEEKEGTKKNNRLEEKLENDNVNDNKNKSSVQKTNTNIRLLPDNYVKFDKDLNGNISYDEIIKLIDSFFDDDPNVKGEDITSLIDYFFDN